RSIFGPRQVLPNGLCCAWSMRIRAARRASFGGNTMTIDPVIVSPLIALIAGILILLMPRLLNYVVAIYLIAIGIIGLAHHFQYVEAARNPGQKRRQAYRQAVGK